MRLVDKYTLLAFVLIAVVAFSVSTPALLAQQPMPTTEIVYKAYSDDAKGLAALKMGEIDIYVPKKPVTVDDLKAAGISPEDVRIYTASGGIAVMLLNILSDDNECGKLGIVTDPEGKKHFNPFAIREIRFALNLMINRKYIAERVVGFAYPAFVALSPQLPYYDEIQKAVEELGFKPEGDIVKAAEIVDKVMHEIAEKLPKVCGAGYKLYKGEDGFWYFQAPGQEPEKITIHIATWWESYVYHCGAMRYLATEIKKLGFDADAKCTHARKYRDSKDWRYMHWHIYTYRRVISEDLMRIWFIDGMYWTYSSAAIPTQLIEHLKKMGDTLQPKIDELCKELGKAKTISELLAKEKELVKLVMKQSIVIAYTNPLRTVVVSKKVHDAVIGWASIYNNPWLYRLAWTDSGVLRIGWFSSQMNLLTTINPTIAMNRVWAAVVQWPVVDVGTFPNPYTAQLVPLRVSWSVSSVPSLPKDALFYDWENHKWTTVSTAESEGMLDTSKVSKEHIVKIVYNYRFGKWQHGRDMKLFDVILWLTWNLEWAYKSKTGKDPWYFENRREHPVGGVSPYALECFYGLKILNSTAIEVYTSTDCLGVSTPDTIAERFIGMVCEWGPRTLWPWYPPELMLAVGYLRIYGGPATGKQYILAGKTTENIRLIDFLNADCVKDLKAALKKIAGGEYEPPFVKAVYDLAKKYPAIGSIDLAKGAEGLIKFADTYGHLLVSQGPFILVEAKPDKLVYKPFTQYQIQRRTFVSELKSAILEVSKVEKTAPMVMAGKTATIKLYLKEKIVFPESEAGSKPAEQAYVVARILKEGVVVAEVKGKKAATGEWVIEIPPEITSKLKPGTYTVEILYALSPGAPMKKVTTEITILPSIKPTTVTTAVTKTTAITKTTAVTKVAQATVTTTATVTVVKTTKVQVPTTVTTTVVETNWGTAIGIAIVLLIIGFVAGYMVRKR